MDRQVIGLSRWLQCTHAAETRGRTARRADAWERARAGIRVRLVREQTFVWGRGDELKEKGEEGGLVSPGDWRKDGFVEWAAEKTGRSGLFGGR